MVISLIPILPIFKLLQYSPTPPSSGLISCPTKTQRVYTQKDGVGSRSGNNSKNQHQKRGYDPRKQKKQKKNRNKNKTNPHNLPIHMSPSRKTDEPQC
jgi:hypothetical protein